MRTLQKDGRLAFSAESFCLSPEALFQALGDYPVYMGDAFTLGRGPLPPKTLLSIAAKQLPSYAGNAKAAADDLKIYRKQDYRVVILAGDQRRAEVLQNWLDREGICVSRGSACARGRRSHVLTAMGLPPAVIDGALRVSFSPETTDEEVLRFAGTVSAAADRFFPKWG